MQFAILGPLEVHDGAGPVSLGGGHQRKLLAILLLHSNRSVSNDRLIEELWGGRPPETAAKALQGLVSQLRRQLGAGTVETVPGGYRLRVDSADVDALRFERLLQDARSHDQADALAMLRQALDLWRGPALSEFAYDDFARAEIERLEELRETAIERRIELELALGHHDDLVPELEALVREHPLRERLRRLLMLALYRSGRQADALEAYHDARRVLRHELGLEPGDELQELQRRILAHDPSLAAPPRAESRPIAVARRRPALVLTAAGALVLTGAVVAVILLMRGGRASPVVVPPNSVAMIDVHHNRVASYVGVGRHPVALAIGGQGVWVVNAEDGTVNELDPRTGKLLHTVGIGADVNDAAVGFGSVWVADGNDGTLTRIDAATGQVQRTLQLAAPGTLAPTTVFFVATDGRYVWATLAGVLLRIDPATNRVDGRVTVGAPLTLATGGGSVWVTIIAEHLLRIDPASLKITASTDMSNGSFATAFGEKALWLVYGFSSGLSRVDPITLAVVSAPTDLGLMTAVAVGAGSVWVADVKGAIERIDFRTGKVTATLHVGGRISAIAVEGDKAWVAVTAAT